MTVDLHLGDDPRDIDAAAAWLAEQRIPATFFAPSTMFALRELTPALLRLVTYGHEVGSHSHLHDWPETRALIAGHSLDLKFLEDSARRAEDLFGVSPQSFRSPRWCFLGQGTRAELTRLGYRVDSSATPQRPALLSSLPFGASWMWCQRAPYYLAPGLLEIPTSTFLVPAATPTFAILRSLSQLFLHPLALEALALRERMLTLQFHAADFQPASSAGVLTRRRSRPTIADYWPQPEGGIRARHFLRETDRERIVQITHALIARIGQYPTRFVTLSEAARLWAERFDARAAGQRARV